MIILRRIRQNYFLNLPVFSKIKKMINFAAKLKILERLKIRLGRGHFFKKIPQSEVSLPQTENNSFCFGLLYFQFRWTETSLQVKFALIKILTFFNYHRIHTQREQRRYIN